MLSKSKLTAAGLLAAVAVAGFAGGFATSSWAGGAGGGRERQSWSARLTRDLNLSRAQSDSVSQILQRHRAEMREVFESVRPRMDSVRSRINDEIRAVLTPGQRRAYEDMLQRERDRVARWRADTSAHDRGGRGGH